MLNLIRKYLFELDSDKFDQFHQNKLVLASMVSGFLGVTIIIFIILAYFIYGTIYGIMSYLTIYTFIIAVSLFFIPKFIRMGYHLSSRIFVHLSILSVLLFHSVAFKFAVEVVEPMDYFLPIIYLLVLSLFPFLLFSRSEKNLNFVLFMLTIAFIAFHDHFLGLFNADARSIGIYTPNMEYLPYLLFMISMMGGGSYYLMSITNRITNNNLVNRISDLESELKERKDYSSSFNTQFFICNEDGEILISNRAHNKYFYIYDNEDIKVLNIDLKEMKKESYTLFTKNRFDPTSKKISIFKSHSDECNFMIIISDLSDEDKELLFDQNFSIKAKNYFKKKGELFWEYDIKEQELDIDDSIFINCDIYDKNENIMFWDLMNKVSLDQKKQNNVKIESLIKGECDFLENNLELVNKKNDLVEIKFTACVLEKNDQGRSSKLCGLIKLLS